MSDPHLSIRTALLRWYDSNARDLPWRGISDPYAILVSEVMSQQTRVETVRDYWTRWLERFPTVGALASAVEDDVMAQWSGLGYYRRARNLHAAAKLVHENDGEFPNTFDALRELPGVGAYTAGAVASIAFGEAVPAVDGNVIRVVSRLFSVDGDPGRVAFKRAIEGHAVRLIEAHRAGDSNQALMELGATICKPKGPDCESCPVAEWCASRASGNPTRFPPPRRKAKQRAEDRVTIVPRNGERVFVRKRPDEGLLARTWEFPTFEVSTVDAARSRLATEHGLAGELVECDSVEHIFSHIVMTYRVWLQATTDDGEGGQWLAPAETGDVGLSTAMRKVLERALGTS